jgi:hypothetical protein
LASSTSSALKVTRRQEKATVFHQNGGVTNEPQIKSTKGWLLCSGER